MNSNIKFSILYLFIGMLAWPIAGQAQDDAAIRKLERAIEKSPVFSKGFTGFLLSDPLEQRDLYAYRADNYFTPASNTKVFSFYAASVLLGDELPALFYQKRNDSLFIWGTGNPLLLHPDFSQGDTIFNWLKEQEAHLVFSDANYLDERYGEGWSWDDYPYGYQMEKSSLPLYGNAVEIAWDGLGEFTTYPEQFEGRFVFDESPNALTVGRYEYANIYTFSAKALRRRPFKRRLSFLTNGPLVTKMLSDTLGKTISYQAIDLPANGQYQTFSIPAPDSMYQALLQDSDNFIAEQILLMASAKRYGTMESQRVIKFLTDTLMSALPEDLSWVDGSGLSRYNQITPRGMTNVLSRLYSRYPRERLFSLFPAGGESGTIKKWYGGKKTAYVFAKTGTLRHVHCLSGYLLTKSGRVLVFSFMHNNFPGKTSELKKEMEKILLFIREHVDSV